MKAYRAYLALLAPLDYQLYQVAPVLWGPREL